MAAKRRVLVINDDQLTLRLTTHVFQKGGYEVHVAGSGWITFPVKHAVGGQLCRTKIRQKSS
jgi:CheY-like chemotaxis protein